MEINKKTNIKRIQFFNSPFRGRQSEDVKKISSNYIKNTDKWYRMLMGLSSDLDKYEDGIIYLSIKNTEKQLSSSYETALRIVKSWIEFNKELSGAKGFVVSFYTTKSTGFMLNCSDPKDEQKIKDVVEKIKAYAKDSTKPELINIFSGLL